GTRRRARRGAYRGSAPDERRGCARRAARGRVRRRRQLGRGALIVSATLAAIVAATFLSGAVSVLAAAWLSLSLLAGVVRRMVSLSAGLLLGSAMLNLLPEAFESGADVHSLSWTLLAGVIAFFALEKFAVLRHSHHHEHDGHGHHHGHDRDEAGPGGLVVLVGDSIHNAADGVIIAAAFLAAPALGWVT